MNVQTTETSVQSQIVVEAPIDEAFSVFTEGIGSWFPSEYNLLEVEVRFTSEAPERTRVELEHRHLDRHGEGWQQTRESISGEGGWPGCLRRFAQRLAA